MGFLATGHMTLALVCAGFATLVLLLWSALSSGRRESKLPPGPPTIPLFGNELQIPKVGAHFKFQQWSKEYGGIFSVKRFRNTTIVITDPRIIKELVDKKSSMYSHRPQSLVSDLITNSDHLLVMQYGERWRQLRKAVHQYFMEAKCEKDHWKVQDAEASQMLYDFLTMPEDHMFHPKRYSNSITNSLVFGIRSKSVHDEYMKKLFHLLGKWSLVLELGATPPVDDFALLRILPERIVGYWRTPAIEVQNLMTSLYKTVLDQVRERRVRGIKRTSFMDGILDGMEKMPMTEGELQFLGGVLMEGGSDTSSSLILTIIQALTKFPRVQAKAHTEIDAHIGSGRSPTWSDFAKLPYINCMIKEAHRWRPVSPLGVPHSTAEDDYINGMLIPKGSTIVLNVWGIHHDEKRWSEPEDFNPDRFSEHAALAPAYAASGDWEKRDHYGYGAGRRICPGIHLAERNLFIGIAKLLWAFEFTQPTGAESDTDPRTGASQGFLRAPKEYGLAIKLRSPEKRNIIFKEFEEAKSVFARFD